MSNQQATETADLENDHNDEQQNDDQEDTLRAMLESSYEASEATNDDEPIEGELEASDGTLGDETGDEVVTDDDLITGDKAAEKIVAKEGDTDDKPIVEDKIEYPEHWDKTTKDDFDKLPESMQKFVVGRVKDMEADYTRKRQADSDVIRTYEPVRQIMAPFQEALKKSNMTEAQLITNWARAENHLNTNPHLAIKQLADHYGVDITELAYGGARYNEAPEVDPVIQNLTQQVSSLQTTISTEATNKQMQAIDSFADQTDEKGEKLHPYFDDVLQDVMLELQIDRQQGQQSDLGTLYERACYRNTSVREKLLEAQRKAATTETTEAANIAAANANKEARLRADKAKKAGKSVVGDPGGAVAHKGKIGSSIRETLDDAWNENT